MAGRIIKTLILAPNAINMTQNPTPADLRDIGLKATGPRMKILDFFHQNSGTHYSAEDVFMALKEDQEIGLATVYRTLADMAAAGEADSLQSKDGEALYRACTSNHHHHLICRKCGLTLEIEAQNLEKWADQVANQHGFSQPSHNIDIFGVCAGCR